MHIQHWLTLEISIKSCTIHKACGLIKWICCTFLRVIAYYTWLYRTLSTRRDRVMRWWVFGGWVVKTVKLCSSTPWGRNSCKVCASGRRTCSTRGLVGAWAGSSWGELGVLDHVCVRPYTLNTSLSMSAITGSCAPTNIRASLMIQGFLIYFFPPHTDVIGQTPSRETEMSYLFDGFVQMQPYSCVNYTKNSPQVLWQDGITIFFTPFIW